jgi:gamma-glutamyltranspeptidase/glutathione hydrolase
MKKKNYLRNIGSLTLKIIALLLLVLILDILINGSIYHPLTYLYKLLSQLACNLVYSQSCHSSVYQPQSPILGKQGMVVTTQDEATKVGLEILRQGGNAIDAAVAVGYALAVTEPCCGNLGGGGFMLIRLANGKTKFINFREKAPLAASKDMYLDANGDVIASKSREGYLAVAVPGTVKGLEYAQSKYGSLPRHLVIQPAIDLAEQGFILTKSDLQVLKFSNEKLKAENVSRIFKKEGKSHYQPGDILAQKQLGKTLRLIAQKGEKAFYRGEIATKIVEASQENGGILSLDDFTNYTISEQEPLDCYYRGYQVISAPPPGGGLTLCQMLNVLEGYQLKELGWHTYESLELLLSTMLYAYSDRNNYLADPDFVKIPIDRLLSPDYARQIRSKIATKKSLSPHQVLQKNLQDGKNTTHYSIVDKYGNAVAVTYTINSYFGAGVIAQDTGFFLNNEMDDFTISVGSPNQFGLVQGEANLIEPGKRPLSSMSPTIMTKNGQLVLITGSPGGSTIPTTVLQIITNLVDFKMNLDQSVNSPRIHYQGLPNIVITEPFAVNDQVYQLMWSNGYRVIPFIPWGAAESIYIDQRQQVFQGVHDRRKPQGQAKGF